MGIGGGVFAGVGQAVSQLGRDKREERLAALQHDREMALKRMDQEYNSGERQKDRDMNVSEGGKDRQQRVGEMMRADDRAAEERRSRESEGEKDRKNRKEIAGIQAGARTGAATGKKRWTINKVANESVADGKISKTEDIVLTDNQKGLTFKQQGDMFVMQGSQPKPHPRRAEAEARLRQNPETAQDFASHFGYLPSWFVQFAEQPGTGESDNYEEE